MMAISWVSRIIFGRLVSPIKRHLSREKTFWAHLAAGASRDAKGAPVRRVVISDITERKLAEKSFAENQIKLTEAKQMLQLVIDTIPVRVFWKDLNLTYLGCNSLFARDAGRQLPADLIGKNDYCMGWREQADLYRQDDQEVIDIK